MAQVILHKKDGVDAMAELESGSLDLLFTDLPCPQSAPNQGTPVLGMIENFFVTPGWEEFSFDQWKEAFCRFLQEANRLLRESGTMVLFTPLWALGTVSALAEEQHFRPAAHGVWHRKNADPRHSVTGWVCLCRKDCAVLPTLPDHLESTGLPAGQRKFGKHPSQMAESIAEHFLSQLTVDGNWVLDPFMGSGTTGVAAQRLGRNFIGAELDGGFYAMAKARIRGQSQEKPKAIDLFSGAGGLSLGFARRGFDVVLACEQDPETAGAYQHNHPDTELVLGDLLALDIQEIFAPLAGTIDVILAGPPFQEVNKHMGLLRRFVQILELVQPQYFVLETDPHLLTGDNGRHSRSLNRLLEKAGYRLNTGILNAADYGIPQQRRRAVILGKRGSWAPELPMETGETVTVWDAIGDLAFLASGEGSTSQPYPDLPISAYGRALRGESQTLFNHIATKHAVKVLERLALIPPGSGREVLPEEWMTKSTYSGTWCRMLPEGPSVPIGTRFDTPASGRFTHPTLDRAITVREAARLQSFPDDFLFTGSTAAQMKQVGNALPPKLAQAIAAIIQQDMEK